ncbi:S-adenosylhomocysteine deaminase [Streptomyces sp. NL15-2K]|nr:S-adenosylhomocysteine deaminase [Streptomyces sp. NL15-2K]
MPRGDLARQLVWGHVSRTVRDVLVDGRVVVRDRRPTGIDLAAVAEAAAERSAALLRRAGLTPRPTWPAEPAGTP